MVPSRTPLSRPKKSSDSTAAITVMEESKMIFVVPKFVCQTCTTARTNDSPGSMTTSASTSR